MLRPSRRLQMATCMPSAAPEPHPCPACVRRRYERYAIEAWLASSGTSPMTGTQRGSAAGEASAEEACCRARPAAAGRRRGWLAPACLCKHTWFQALPINKGCRRPASVPPLPHAQPTALARVPPACALQVPRWPTRACCPTTRWWPPCARSWGSTRVRDGASDGTSARWCCLQ